MDFANLLVFGFQQQMTNGLPLSWDICSLAYVTQHLPDAPLTSLIAFDHHCLLYLDIKYRSCPKLGHGPSSLLTLQS